MFASSLVAALDLALFCVPPAENRPECWWWFSNGMTEKAIVHDLDAMARVGLSGFHFYGGDRTCRDGVEKCRFTLREAAKRGLRASIVIGSAGCGHPKTSDQNLQKELVFAKADVVGGNAVSLDLPRGTTKGAVSRLYHDIAVLAVPKTDVVAPESVLDLTDALVGDTLAWKGAPEGDWIVIRVGYVPRVGGNHTDTGRFIDHMSRKAFDAHWQVVMKPLLMAVTPEEKSVLRGVVCDSWEAGTCTWTEGFDAEFRKRRGYDLRRWLPFKAGVACSDAKRSEKFMRDFDLTVADLITENHYAYKKEVANRSGLLAITEAAGPHQNQGDGRRMQGRADVAMGEFWAVSAHRPGLAQRFMLRDSAMAAHVYGIREIQAEAFTQLRTCWTSRPRDLKSCADRSFCEGLTRVCYHGFDGAVAELPRRGIFVHLAGMHYNPQLTWFEQSTPLNLYLARCSWMCSQGVPTADCLLYAGDGQGVMYGMRRPSDGLGFGYDYDVAPTELLLAARVEDGEIVLPSGARYRTLFVSDRNPASRAEMSAVGNRLVRTYAPKVPYLPPEAEKKMAELEWAGAKILRTRGELERFVESGVLKADFAVQGADESDIGWVHRRVGDEDVYFVANYRDAAVSPTVELRATGRQTSVWDAVDGTCSCITAEKTADGRTRVKLQLPAFGSIFIVIGRTGFSSSVDRRLRLPDFRSLASVPGPWTVAFDPELGGPKEPIVVTNLFDWTTSAREGVRYYSGTAMYRTTFVLDSEAEDVVLDLGEVADVAEVLLNGRCVGIAWTMPMRVALGGALRKGENELEVRVTNRWFNRFVIDETRPLDKRIALPARPLWNVSKLTVTDPGDRPFRSGLLGPVTLLKKE